MAHCIAEPQLKKERENTMNHTFSCDRMEYAITSIADKYNLDLTQTETHIRLDMPHFDRLCIEVITPNQISVAHYFEQNGDLMADPELVFWITPLGRWIPIEWKLDALAQHQYYVTRQGPDGSIREVRVPHGIRELADTWARNLESQDWLNQGQRYWRAWPAGWEKGYYRAYLNDQLVYSHDSLVNVMRQFARCEWSRLTVQRADDTDAFSRQRWGMLHFRLTDRHNRQPTPNDKSGDVVVFRQLLREVAQEQADGFAAWMKQVDNAIAGVVGLVSDDLADQTYRDWFNAGWPPQEAARCALASEGFDW
jgi:hypothetical protein